MKFPKQYLRYRIVDGHTMKILNYGQLYTFEEAHNLAFASNSKGPKRMHSTYRGRENFPILLVPVPPTEVIKIMKETKLKSHKRGT